MNTALNEHGLLWPPSFAAGIFDFDGTLADTWQLWQHVDEVFFAERGLPYDQEAHKMLNVLGFEPGARWVIERYQLREDPADICDEWNRMGRALYAREVELRPGALNYLRALRGAGVPLALATTNDPQVLRSMAPRFDVYGLFDAVVCGREVLRPKDHPDIYLEAARRLGAEPTHCMVFEDIVVGTRSAKSVGMRTCGVRSTQPTQPVSELKSEADVFIDGFEGLLGQ